MEDTQKLKYKAKLIEGKLMLTSSDIQVGDKMIYEGTGKEAIATEDRLDFKPAAFKVIGEISPNATWVKEGDEFDEDEIIRTYSERDYDPEAEEANWYTYQIKGTDSDPKCPDSWHFNPIKIKCPCCNKFA